MTTLTAPRPDAAPAVSPLTITPEQTEFTPVQREALRTLGVTNPSDVELQLFFHQARRLDLDPFAKQIYMMADRALITTWDQGRQVEEWGTKWSTQLHIDGFRLTGHRLAEQRGDELEDGEPLWAGPDGTWREFWSDKATPPVAAKYIIRKNGRPYCGVVMYHEYVRTMRNRKPDPFWARMPAGQLAKCAEALAWRKAYPRDFSGIGLEGAGSISDADVAATTGDKATPPTGAAALRAAVGLPEPSPDSTEKPAPKKATARRRGKQ
ncbi:recombinase RecT [Nocardia wallacei]|uniref:recombinase RecT n=1 Tax=Nocardia wallacei TaxID=480035 RepID=UPI002457507B|nr:recombinase RecT [Nocardia wallacei]